MGSRFRILIVIAGCLYYDLVGVEGTDEKCKGSEITLKCTALKQVKRKNYKYINWKFRERWSDKDYNIVAYCDDNLKCNQTEEASAEWRKFFTVENTMGGSLVIKLLDETDELVFGCEVEKNDHSSPAWNNVSFRVKRCFVTESNVTACVGRAKVLKCDSVQRVEPNYFEDLKWQLLRNRTSWDNLSYCNRKFFCGTKLRGYRVMNTSLVLLNVENDGKKTYGCEVTKKDQSTPDFHKVNVFPVVCPKTTPPTPPAKASAYTSSGSTFEPAPTNSSAPWSPTVNSTFPPHRSTADRIVSRGATLSGILVILGLWY